MNHTRYTYYCYTLSNLNMQYLNFTQENSNTHQILKTPTQHSRISSNVIPSTDHSPRFCIEQIISHGPNSYFMTGCISKANDEYRIVVPPPSSPRKYDTSCIFVLNFGVFTVPRPDSHNSMKNNFIYYSQCSIQSSCTFKFGLSGNVCILYIKYIVSISNS